MYESGIIIAIIRYPPLSFHISILTISLSVNYIYRPISKPTVQTEVVTSTASIICCFFRVDSNGEKEVGP